MTNSNKFQYFFFENGEYEFTGIIKFCISYSAPSAQNCSVEPEHMHPLLFIQEFILQCHNTFLTFTTHFTFCIMCRRKDSFPVPYRYFFWQIQLFRSREPLFVGGTARARKEHANGFPSAPVCRPRNRYFLRL